jgi:radical SAM protein with 4Fe4S-binding SPASM domain
VTPADFNALLDQHGLTPPETLTFSLLDCCNLRCSHCWLESGPSLNKAGAPPLVAKGVIEDYAALGGAAIRFTGGEPLLHSDWLELLGFAGATGLKVLLQSNGTLFDDDSVANLRGLGLHALQIQISLDGATAAVHDRVRGAGSFRKTVAAIRRLVAQGFGRDVAIFFTEMQHNLHELPELFQLAEQLGVGSVSSGSLVVRGRADREGAVVPPAPQQYEILLERYAEDSQFRRRYDRCGNIAALEWSNQGAAGHGCHFILNPYLSSRGDLFPCLLCHADNYAVAGVFDKGLAAALVEGLPLWARLQKLSCERPFLLAECQSCPFFKSCAGGCMGRAWESFASFVVPDDRCQQRKTVLSWKEKQQS